MEMVRNLNFEFKVIFCGWKSFFILFWFYLFSVIITFLMKKFAVTDGKFDCRFENWLGQQIRADK